MIGQDYSLVSSGAKTFNNICKEVAAEAGISDTGPSTVHGQKGELASVVRWVKRAWIYIQAMSVDWKWMWAEQSFNTTIGDRYYSYDEIGIASFKKWQDTTALIYKTSEGLADQNEIPFIDWDDFKKTYLTGSQTNDRPQAITIRPDRSLVLGPNPDADYTITTEYFTGVIPFLNDGDVPGMPPEYHDILVYLALLYYADKYEAAYSREAWRYQYQNLLIALKANQLPQAEIDAEPIGGNQ